MTSAPSGFSAATFYVAFHRQGLSAQLRKYSHTDNDDAVHGAWRRVYERDIVIQSEPAAKMVPSRTCISGPVGPPGRYGSCPCPRFLPWITHFTWQFTDILNCFPCFLVAGVATGLLKTQDCLLRSNIQYIYQNLSNLVRCLSQLSGTRRPPQNDSHLSVPF